MFEESKKNLNFYFFINKIIFQPILKMSFLSRRTRKERGQDFFLQMLRGGSKGKERAGPYPRESPRRLQRKSSQESAQVQQKTTEPSTLASENIPEGFARLGQSTEEAGTSEVRGEQDKHKESGTSYEIETPSSPKKRRREDDDGIFIK